ncbi:site-specific integrase [Deinococcus sp. QL22]|uniref:tyrosine-type recombinase/integrase n=1 Tax=Deinococcus sp. QL22 TaxID=2939437 RepID=UPI00201741B2|nr:site-specific integrase [Deinococcus sp. QL22]UQN10411.1 tyrosine-type recombinase/integrase [Deinococcus sp. QL22]UQN10545.1 tyrosine-type recombinase/integrase [Deinococcus sp. QL22]
MTLELMASNLTLQARAERLALLDPEALRKEAIRAARDRDEAGLWAVTEAFLVMRGGRGARVSAQTLEAYAIGLRVLLAWGETSGLSFLRPRPNDGYAFVRHLEGLGLAPSSVRVRLAGARAVFAALRWAGATDAAPFTDVRAATDPVPAWQKRKPYPDADVRKLLAEANEEDAVLILLGADCGLRATEMTTLLRADLHFGGDTPYLVVTGKRQKRQEVPLSRRTEAALKRWVEMTPSYKPHVITLRNRRAIEDRIGKLCERAGVRYDGRQVHGLRHTAGTRVYQETKDVLAVRDHLRHASITTSETYVNYARQGEKAVNRDW